MADEMKDDVWAEVDAFLEERLIGADDALTSAVAASEAAGLPAIQVSAAHGKLLMLLAQSIGARRILEIGTLGAYSSIWMARALPAGGWLITIEANPKHAEVARTNLARAGVADRVEIRLGLALERLAVLATEHPEPFDLVFIDADKINTSNYFDWALRLTHPGSLILVDNVVRGGQLIDAASQDENVRGMRAFVARLAGEPRVSATVIQTVGAKGYDGFAIARVR